MDKYLQNLKKAKSESAVPPGTHEIIISMLKTDRPYKVLDALAYKGYFSKKLHDKGFDVTACDLYPEQFEINEIECVKADLNRVLPFEDSTFDYVILCEAIEHLENPWHLLRESSRILKSGGRVILSTPNILSVLSRFLFFTKGVYLYFNPDEYRKPYHINPITYNELEMILKDTGFEIEEIRGGGHKMPSFALFFLKILRISGLIITDIIFYFYVIITKQTKPMTNKEITKVLSDNQTLIIKAKKEGEMN